MNIARRFQRPSGQRGWVRHGVLAIICVGIMLLVACGSATPQHFAAYLPSQHIYDQAHVLTATETAQLEQQTVMVQDAGAPTVVYLRVKAASQETTIQDAADLMNAWQLESRPGAKDGLVILLNLTPGDIHHGNAAFYAGAKHIQGNLPETELQRIYDQDMAPLLKHGQLAAGIGAGLAAVAHDLVAGPPPVPSPSPFVQFLRIVVTVPLTLLSIILALWVAIGIYRIRRMRPMHEMGTNVAYAPPDALGPALAGAVVVGQVRDDQIAATLLALAQRGAIHLEPLGKRQMQLVLHDHEQVQGPMEEALWQNLVHYAKDGIRLKPAALAAARRHWQPIREILRRDLVQRQWFADDLHRRRALLNRSGIVGIIGVAIGVILTLIAQTAWGFLGDGILLVATCTAFIASAMQSETTVQGEDVALPWRALQRGIKRAKHDAILSIDLDRVLPYALAMGSVEPLQQRLKVAGKAGFLPSWLVNDTSVTDFYPYWLFFYGTFTTSGSASSSTGAATGGGGAGGSF
ncbi:MAG: DUF2207 domain-containing protein [Ktedonobacterales bacterium]|nr:DUF2207 domain-containing protein [Ktedonobacterales bacterium]